MVEYLACVRVKLNEWFLLSLAVQSYLPRELDCHSGNPKFTPTTPKPRTSLRDDHTTENPPHLGCYGKSKR